MPNRLEHVRPSASEVGGDGVGGHRARIQVTLRVLASERGDLTSLELGFHALGDDRQPEITRQLSDRRDDGEACRGRPDADDEGAVDLDDDAARRLAERAEREGIEPSALAQRLLSEASEVDPFEFIGSFASDAVRGRDADEFLDREGFGAP